MTKISVCIATYNGSKYIRRQLDTILQQLPGDYEVIISDDSSTDNTLDIVKSYNNSHIIILPNQKFRNPIYNFENALKHASGDVIFLSDQDDIWQPTKVEKALAALNNCDIVLSDCSIIDAEGKVIEESFFKINGSGRGFFKNLWKNSYLGCCLAFRKDVLKKATPFPKDIPMHDWWLGIISETFYRITIINEQLISYRRHGVNATPTGEVSNFPYWDRLGFRLALIKGIFRAWVR
jgi:glycosyltransferase involved in cell wall biosynthesis